MAPRFLFSSALLALLLTGCGTEPTTPLRVGLLVWPAFELPRIAQELGSSHGGQVEFIDFLSPVEAARAYHGGRVDAVALTAQYLLRLEQEQPGEHVAVLFIDESLGGDALVARPGIEALDGLAGRRVGSEASVLGAYMLGRALEEGGLQLDQVEVIPVDVGEQAEAWLTGRLDAVVTYEPIRSELLAAGGKELFASSSMRGEILDVLITRRRTADDPRMRAVVQLWREGLELLRTEPERAASVGAERGGQVPAEFLAALDGMRLIGAEANRAMLGGSDPWLRERVVAIAERMVRMGLLESAPDAAALLSAQALEVPSP